MDIIKIEAPHYPQIAAIYLEGIATGNATFQTEAPDWDTWDKNHYFGTLADPTAALNKYLEERDDLQVGRKPRTRGEGLTVRELVNRFLSAKKSLMDNRKRLTCTNVRV